MENRMQALKVTLIQFPLVFLNLKANLEKALNLMEQAAQQGAGLAVFPESWSPGLSGLVGLCAQDGALGLSTGQDALSYLIRKCHDHPGAGIQTLALKSRKIANEYGHSVSAVPSTIPCF